MANYATLKAAINAVIKANGNKEITGTVLNETLTAMVNSLGADYQFAGVATPSTNPGTPDQNVFYLAGQAGTYTNFNSIVLPDGVSILKWNGSWSGETILAGDGDVFDISAYKATGGTLATFADLSAALDGGNNIPQSLRKGGMSVKFVQSSDNKYVQYRLMSNSFSTNITDWQGVDDEPTAGSNNLVKSGGVAAEFKKYFGYPSKEIDLTGYGTHNGIISGGNFILTTNSNYQYIIIPVAPGEKYHVVKGSIYRFTYAFLKSYTEPQEGTPADFCTGTTDVDSGDSTLTLEIPQDGKYLCIQVLSGGTPKYPQSFTLLANDGDVFQKTRDTFLYKIGNNVWKSNPNGDDSTLFNDFNSVKRMLIYSAIRSAHFYGYEPIPRTISYIWNGYGDKFRLVIKKYENGEWSPEFNFSKPISGLKEVETFESTYGNKRATFEVDTTMIPYIADVSGSTPLNSGEPELIFSDNCYDFVSVELETQQAKTIDLSSLTQIGGLINNGVWSLVGHSSYKYVLIPVSGGDTIKIIKGTANIEYSVLRGYESPQEGDTPYYANGYSGTIVSATSTLVKIPNNGKYLYLYAMGGGNNVLPSSVTIEKRDGLFGELEDALQIPKVIKMFPKSEMAAISFNFDDINVEDEQVVNLFDSYGAVCSFAFIADDVKIANYKDRYIGYQRRGYGICSHSIDGVPFSMTSYPTIADARGAIMTAQNKLSKAGLVVNGFVAPSSQWYLNENEQTQLEYLEGSVEKAHAYAFTFGDSHGNSRQSNPCRLSRISIEANSLETLEALIDSQIAAGKIITLYGHSYNIGTGNFTMQKLESLLQYVISKRDAGLCYFGNTDDCVKYFFKLY